MVPEGGGQTAGWLIEHCLGPPLTLLPGGQEFCLVWGKNFAGRRKKNFGEKLFLRWEAPVLESRCAQPCGGISR